MPGTYYFIMTIREQLPYKDIPAADLVRVTAPVSIADRRTVMAALGGDDGILTFIVQSIFKHAADYVRTNKLNAALDPSAPERLVTFIKSGGFCNGADPCTVGDEADKPVHRPAPRRKPKVKAT